MAARVELAGTEVGGDDLDVLVQVALRLDARLLEREAREAVRARTVGGGGHLAVHPRHRLPAVGELRRVVAHEEDVALLLRRAEHRDDADVRASALLDVAERRGDRRHVAHVADVLLLAGHRVHDHRALQPDLELGGRALRQVLLPEALAVVDHPGPRLGVVRLVADDQIHRFAFLAEIDARRSILRRYRHRERSSRHRYDLLHVHSNRHHASSFWVSLHGVHRCTGCGDRSRSLPPAKDSGRRRSLSPYGNGLFPICKIIHFNVTISSIYIRSRCTLRRLTDFDSPKRR